MIRRTIRARGRVGCRIAFCVRSSWLVSSWHSIRACTHKSAFYKRGSVYVRFAPKATEVLRCRELTRCAVTGLTHCSKPGARLQRLFDHLVGRGQARSPGSRGRAQALFRAAPQYRLCNFRLSLPLELTISERWYSLRHVRRYDLG